MSEERFIAQLQAAHTRTEAPGVVVEAWEDGRYVVEVERPGRLPALRRHRFKVRPDNRVTVKPCWTEHTPDGKAVQHRRSATE